MRKILVSREILENFPATAIGVLVISNLKNEGHEGEILPLLRAEELRQRDLLNAVELPSLPELKVWRDAYKKFGSDPRDFRPSVEALLRRARAGNKPLPHINDLVDLYNYISIKYHVPVGAEDLAKIKGNVELTFAKGHEAGLALGATESESCYSGEVIYRDDEGFLCRRWNWREADRTKLEASTTSAILVIDTVGGLAPETLERSLDETKSLVETILGAKVTRAILNAASTEFGFEG